MHIIKMAASLTLAIFIVGCGEKSGGTPAQEPAAAPAPASTAPEAETSQQAEPIALITSVHAQWIISDSMPKTEITLFGENLPPNPTITSLSPQATVESVEAATGQVRVLVAMSLASPAGDYEFQYLAPGQAPIPFTIRYAGMKKE